MNKKMKAESDAIKAASPSITENPTLPMNFPPQFVRCRDKWATVQLTHTDQHYNTFETLKKLLGEQPNREPYAVIISHQNQYAQNIYTVAVPYGPTNYIIGYIELDTDDESNRWLLAFIDDYEKNGHTYQTLLYENKRKGSLSVILSIEPEQLSELKPNERFLFPMSDQKNHSWLAKPVKYQEEYKKAWETGQEKAYGKDRVVLATLHEEIIQKGAKAGQKFVTIKNYETGDLIGELTLRESSLLQPSIQYCINNNQRLVTEAVTRVNPVINKQTGEQEEFYTTYILVP